MTSGQCTDSLAGLLEPYARGLDADLAALLVEPGTPDALAEAMRYCVGGGGKRLRPALVRLAAEAFGYVENGPLLRRSAVAVELIHCYSLVHDDLPAMDDDTLRRGRPTAHVRFGQAMAILAGDALLTRAMGLPAESDDPRAIAVTMELARSAGPAGMVAGQVADMALCDVEDGLAGLRYINARKTAALIRAATRIGAICADAGEEDLRAISDYGHCLGMAFQLVDGILDVTGDATTLGKTPGKDADSDKRTHVALLGIEAAGEMARDLTQQARRALQPLGDGAAAMVRLAELLSQRTY